jgi:hypothetical protein
VWSKRLRDIFGVDWVFIVGDPMIILDAILIVGIIVDRKRFLRDILADAVVWYYI